MEESLVLITHEGDRISAPKQLSNLSEFIAFAAETTLEVDIGDLGIDTEALQLVLEYCAHHDFQPTALLLSPLKSGTNLSELHDPWDVTFLSSKDDDTTLRLILAAKALGIASLVQLIATSISVSFMGKDEPQVSLLMGEEVVLDEREEGYLKLECPWSLTSRASRDREYHDSQED